MGKPAKTKLFVDIVAECATHGRFQVRKKPNKNPPGSGTTLTAGYYQAVKCPVCPFWGKIISQSLVTEVETAAAAQGSLL